MVLNEELLDATLMLGIEPVGISLGRDQPTAAAYLQDRKPDLTYLVNAGLPDAPDVGAVLTAEPDLVLAGDATTPEVLAGLEAIAPTYVARVDGAEWTATLHSVAEALSREDRAATWLGGYEWRTQQVRQQIADAGSAGRSVALVLWTAEGPVVLDETSFAARVAASVGLTPVGRTAGAPGPVVPVSAIPVSDRLFVFARDALGVDGDALEAAMASAEVRALPAVAAGNVSVVDGSAWATRGGPAAAHLVLDDLLAAFGT
jgi:iron complex transport system substrate-binding protein